MKFFKLLFLLVLFTNFLSAGVNSVKNGIGFSYEDPKASSVTIAGTFNDWNTNANPLKKDDDGMWGTVIKLSQGEHQYKFVVDGNWYVDPENPNQTDDGYGGFNSVIVVNEEGQVVVQKVSETQSIIGIKTKLNPKVYFDGRYYTKGIFVDNENSRFMLEKPLHDINIGMKIKFNSAVEGYTVMNINNIAEGTDMWKTHLNFKRSILKLNAPNFILNAFDNFGYITFDDPLHIVGDEGQYHYAFGYDYLGIYGKSKIPSLKFPFKKLPLNFGVELLYADQAGNDDGDISAARGTLEFDLNNSERVSIYTTNEKKSKNEIRVGYSIYSAQFPLSSSSSKRQISNEVDFQLIYKIERSNWKGPICFDFDGEYYSFKNSDIDSITIKWLDGEIIYFGLGVGFLNVQFPTSFDIYGNFQRNKLNFDESLSKNRIVLGCNFSTEHIFANLKLSYWNNDLPDSLVSWNDYFRYLEKTDGNGRWYQKYSDVPFEQYTILGYKTGLLWGLRLGYRLAIGSQKFDIQYQNKVAQIDFTYNPKYIENEVILNWKIAKHWGIYSNTRIPYYNDSFLEIKTDYNSWEDVFICNFSKITYFLSDNIEISLGWGVNPRVLNAVTDEFYDGGRQEFMASIGDFENYLENNYKGLGEKLRTAEQKLMDEQRIGIEAVVKF